MQTKKQRFAQILRANGVDADSFPGLLEDLVSAAEDWCTDSYHEGWSDGYDEGEYYGMDNS